MESINLGLCNKCRGRVPCEFFARDGQMWLRKTCPDCGSTESMVSSDARAWQAKRELWEYVPMQRVACRMNCDRCEIDHKPNIVFVDVTNRCNMNCPICIATIKDMGFDFNPPLAYFDKLFAEVARLEPKPVLLFFGGEPTVRDDLLEIIAAAKKHGLRPHVVTNGIRLADEQYCRRLCEARVSFRFAFDGRSPEIYERLRRNRSAYDKKMRALQNLRKYSLRKHTIMATIGRGFNDQHLGDFFQFCHENRDLISDVGLIPLTENWRPGTFDAGVHTTMEDVEAMVRDAIPGGQVEFVPAGLSWALKTPRSFFRKNLRSEVLLLAGVHPNCESITLLVSDGKSYRGMNHYLRKPLREVAVECAALCRKLQPKLDRLDPARRFPRLCGQVLILLTLLPWMLVRIRLGRLLGSHLSALGGRVFGRPGRLLSGGKHIRRRPRLVLRVGVLPFEEEHSIDAARLEKCKAVFAYEDAEDGSVKYIPACLWYPYRNPILEKLSKKYGVVGKETEWTIPEQPYNSSGGNPTVKPLTVKAPICR
ncbi:MAG TPA: radical SAM protein [Phycisphaerae bacterium]|nr:radical SAM protein [Phycisphaerae bacterium]HRR85655.1 radical SAM protein [Phycisphaerae bacterium]